MLGREREVSTSRVGSAGAPVSWRWGSGPVLGSATRKQSGYLVLGQPVSVGVLKSRQRKGIGGMG
jgi:hypothetical protein